MPMSNSVSEDVMILETGKQGEQTAPLVQGHGHKWGRHILG